MNKNRYPFVIRMPDGERSGNIPWGGKFAIVVVGLVFAAFWWIDGSVMSASAAALAASLLFAAVLAPHALSNPPNNMIKIGATVVVAALSITASCVGLVLIYYLFTMSVVGPVSHYIRFLSALFAGVCFWFAYAYAFQIHYFWKRT